MWGWGCDDMYLCLTVVKMMMMMMMTGDGDGDAREVLMLTIFMWLSILDMILLAIFWNHNAVVFSGNHSVGLILLTFFSGVVGCSGVVFLYAFVR